MPQTWVHITYITIPCLKQRYYNSDIIKTVILLYHACIKQWYHTDIHVIMWNICYLEVIYSFTICAALHSVHEFLLVNENVHDGSRPALWCSDWSPINSWLFEHDWILVWWAGHLRGALLGLTGGPGHLSLLQVGTRASMEKRNGATPHTPIAYKNKLLIGIWSSLLALL